MATPSKTWMITGVSSGFGRALAAAALKRGDRVVGTVRKEADRAALEALSPRHAIGLLLDVTDEAAVPRVFAEAEERTGGIDVLVINAGYGLVGGVEAASLAEIRAQFEVNVYGAVASLQAGLPYMRARHAGRILVVTSVSGLVGYPSLGIYTGSKFALEGICETLALELEPTGVKLTMIEPGGFRTEFAKGSRVYTKRVIDDYDTTVGACLRNMEGHAGHEAGDPAKAAEAMLLVADSPNPPVRLLLGADALGYTRGKLDAQLAEIAAWEKVTTGTAF